MWDDCTLLVLLTYFWANYQTSLKHLVSAKLNACFTLTVPNVFNLVGSLLNAADCVNFEKMKERKETDFMDPKVYEFPIIYTAVA